MDILEFLIIPACILAMTFDDFNSSCYEIYTSVGNQLRFFPAFLINTSQLQSSDNDQTVQWSFQRIGLDSRLKSGSVRVLAREVVVATICFYDALLPSVSTRVIYDMLCGRNLENTHQAWSMLVVREASGFSSEGSSFSFDNVHVMSRVFQGDEDAVWSLIQSRGTGKELPWVRDYLIVKKPYQG